MQTLTSIRRRGWSGRIASLPLSFLSFFFLFSLPRQKVALCVRSVPMRGHTTNKVRERSHGSPKQIQDGGNNQ